MADNPISEIFEQSGVKYPAQKVVFETPPGMETFTGQVRKKREDGSYVIAQVVFHVKAATFAKAEAESVTLEFFEGCDN